jgi:hypothetical protein
MKIRFGVLTALAVSAIFAQQPQDRLVWLDNYEAAKKEASATGKPIFLEFRCAP